MSVRVALDAMGGDHAPAELVQGALEGASADVEVILFGDRAALEQQLKDKPSHPQVRIVHASQQVLMDEHPLEAFRKKPESSLRKAIEAVRDGEADAMVTAGNSGAAMAAAKLTLGTLPGVDRPAIGATMPTMTGRTLLVDAGANVDCSVEQLVQFAWMGGAYARAAWGCDSPRIGLLNIGEEPSKGNTLARSAHERLRESVENFVGNVEGRELFCGTVDVLVCDGFDGNVLLKTPEGLAEMIGGGIRDLAPELGADAVRTVLHRLRAKMDYSVYGGAPLLGVKGLCLIAHGRSSASAISSAIAAAARGSRSRAVDSIAQRLANQRSAP